MQVAVVVVSRRCCGVRLSGQKREPTYAHPMRTAAVGIQHYCGVKWFGQMRVERPVQCVQAMVERLRELHPRNTLPDKAQVHPADPCCIASPHCCGSYLTQLTGPTWHYPQGAERRIHLSVAGAPVPSCRRPGVPLSAYRAQPHLAARHWCAWVRPGAHH